jgi:hypothetical protein
MALVLADRVQETTTTTGTGTVTLLGAVQGFQSFSAVGNANTTYYTIAGQGTSEWEVGLGTYTSSGTTLSRTTVLGSSNSGSLVNFSAGTKNVFVTYPAGRAIELDGTGNFPQAVTAGLGTVRLPGDMVYRLNSNLVTANVNTVQSILGVGVTLIGSIVYQFEAIYMGYKSAGTTSHSIGFGFGGTATLNNIIYTEIGNNNNGAGASQALDAVSDTGWVNTASNTTMINNTSTAAVNFYITLKGTVSVNAGGTFIPQFTLSAAPGGAYTISAGSYFRISPLSASGANTSIGNWA